jgi:YegS/Rv2252/BmrU family lipid kinase
MSEEHTSNHSNDHHCKILTSIAKKLSLPFGSSDKDLWSSGEEEEEEDIENTSSEYEEGEMQEDVEKYEKAGKFPESISLPSHGQICKVHRVLLIYNPYSGSHKGKDIAKKTTRLLSRGGVTVDICSSERQGHMKEIIMHEDLSAYDCLCIVGGDGTFHEAINGLMEKPEDQRKIPLALIPAGTGNSFTLELHGSKNVHRAVKHVLRGLHCPIDVTKIRFGDDKTIYSFNSIHWGLASAVNVRAEKLRWMHCGLRYTTAIFYEFMKGAKTSARIEFENIDGNKTTYEDEFCLLIANNIISAKKGQRMAPEAKLNDGLIDIVLIRSSHTFHLVKAFARTFEGTHTQLEYVEYLKVKSFSVTPIKHTSKGEKVGIEEEVEEIIDVDGELVGHTPFTATVLQRAINIIM